MDRSRDEPSTSSRHNVNVNDSNWSEICDESVLKFLDEPFDAELNHSNLRDDENYRGFDNNTGSTWIYPNNYPVRQYQFNITRAALFRNTLVVLPTGLGKTFIAAVVMYNIYRWYPTGKIIFMAPTKPLVSQQIEACRKITGIPTRDTSEITGRISKKQRRELWKTKRVFFATPQVIQNDVNDIEQDFPIHDVRLVVVDEAHKAKGNHAHAEAVRSIASRNSQFRVLALSATPGRSVDDVIEVIKSLYISHLEIRWETSIDVITYTHRKNIKTVVVPLGTDLTQIRNEFIDIMDPYVRYLMENQVLSGSLSSISRGSIVMEQRRFRELSMTNKHPNESQVKMNFSICVSLYHALELLERHGTRVFLNFFDENEASHRYYVATNPKLQQFLQKLQKYVGANPFLISDQSTVNGKIPEIPDDLDFGHPKFDMVKEKVVDHFQKNEDSRIIVFCEYRESVMLVYRALLQNRPIVKPRVLVGQGGSGSIRAVTQKQQLEVMQQFRAGACNTLVATSVAEEGLDVGEVDLIICFDISTKNPTRFIQRIGRTGRRRQGSIVMMVTEGKEQMIMKDVLHTKEKLNQRVVKSAEVARTLYKSSPRIVPPEFDPKCKEMHMVMIDDAEAAEQKVQKTSKTVSEPKRQRGKKKPIEPSQKNDVRQFFKKLEVDEEDRDDFCSLQAERKNTSVVDPNVLVEINKKRFNRLWQKYQTVKSMPTGNDVTNVLRSSNLPTPIKRFALKSNVGYVREKFEAKKALDVVMDDEIYVLGDEELNLQLEVAAIESVLGKGKIEEFLQENQSSETQHEEKDKFAYIFEGLEPRAISDNVEEFVDQRIKDMANSSVEPFEGNEVVDMYNVNSSNIGEYQRITAIEENEEEFIIEHESRYLSQVIEMDEKRFDNQSTPLRPPIKEKLNADEIMGKELFIGDEFDDDSDPFGVLAAEKDSEKTTPLNADTVAEVPNLNPANENAQGGTPRKESNFFEDEFDDFFVNSQLDTEVAKVVSQHSGDSDSTLNMANGVAKHNPNTSSVNTSTRREDDARSLDKTKFSPAKQTNKNSSRLGIEEFDYTQFFEPLDCDDIAIVEKNIQIEQKPTNKSPDMLDITNISSKCNGTITDVPVTRQKSAELFSSNDRTFPPINPNQEVAVPKASPPMKRPPIALTETSPSVLTRGVNLKRRRLTGSSRDENNFPVSNSVAETSKLDMIGNCANKSLGSSILLSQADSPIVMLKKTKRVIDSDSDVEELPKSQDENISFVANKQPTKRRRLKRNHCEFIDDEAVASEDDEHEERECSELSQMPYDSVVVFDDDIEDHPEVDMRAKYLESIRSPNKKGAFKIPAPRIYNDMSHIFSQAVVDESNSVYKEDSFVVSSDEEVAEEPASQQCPLERAEAILKARRRAKRRIGLNKQKDKVEMQKRIRQRRIVEISSEDESL